jgi:signal transduction histidine kinase
MRPGVGLNVHRRPRWGEQRARSRLAPRADRSIRTDAARAILELSRSVPRDWTASVRRIVEFDAGVLRTDRVSYWTLDDDRSYLRCEQGFVARTHMWESGATISREEAQIYFDGLLEARILVVNDVRTDPRSAGLSAYCEARGIRSMLDVPVWAGGRLAGVLCHEHTGTPRVWGPSDTSFAMGAAQVVSTCIEARAQTSAEAQARQAAFLDRFSRAILQSLEAPEIAQRACDTLAPGFADYAMVHTLAQDGRLECIAISQPAQPSARIDGLMRAARAPGEPPGLATHALRENQALLLPEITPSILERFGVSESLRRGIVDVGLRSAMAIPLQFTHAPFGALVFFVSGRHFGSDDVALARELAERLSAALANAASYQTARAAIRAREDFVLLASHELRTPLASLQLLVDLRMRQHAKSNAQVDLAQDQIIARQTTRLTALVERMLDAMRIQCEGVSLAPEACDVAGLVEAAIDKVASVQTERGALFALSLEPGLVARADRAQLTKAIAELLYNALKFGEGKPVEVSLKREGADAVFTVVDRGVGVPTERLAALFSPFERAASKDNYGGLGLGLFFAQKVVEAHGGSVSATSAPAEGAVFTVRLPLWGPETW